MCVSAPDLPKPPPPPVPQAPPEAPKLVLAKKKKATRRNRPVEDLPSPTGGSLAGGGLSLGG